jgi:L-threonylcarbamoyladenylate synthase
MRIDGIMTTRPPNGALTESHPIGERIARAASLVQAGELVIGPTETFYGILTDPFAPGALEKLFRAKRRDPSKPVPLIAPDRETALRITEPPNAAEEALMKHFWPGSLTILLRPSIHVPAELRGPDGKIGIRAPPDCGARRIAQAAKTVITATSANLSGAPPASNISEVSEELLGYVEMVLDLGATPGGKPSTVVEVVHSEIRVIRHGAVDLADLVKALPK